MQIEALGNKLYIKHAPHESLGILRALPIKKWDAASDVWITPNSPRCREVLAELKGAGTRLPPLYQSPVFKGLDGSLAGVLKTIPRPYQAECLMQMKDEPAWALLMDPGTGKSKVLIDDGAASFVRGEIDHLLIICPNSIKGNWVDEIETHMGVPHVVHAYSAEKKSKATAFVTAKYPGHLKVLIIGVESLSSTSGQQVCEHFLMAGRTCVDVDESSRIKTFDASRTQAIVKLGKKAKRRRTATGTPMTKGPQNIWSQFEFLGPSIFDMEFYPFRATFCVMVDIDTGAPLFNKDGSPKLQANGKPETRKVKKIVGGQHEDILHDLMAPYSFVARKQDVLPELPEKTFMVRTVQPTKEFLRATQELMEEGSMNGVRYSTALVRDLRLHQLTGGFTVTARARKRLEDLLAAGLGEEALEREAEKVLYDCEPLPGRNAKIEDLKDYLDELEEDQKLIVWCKFRAEVEAVANMLREFGEVGEFHGGVHNDERNIVRQRFQNDPKLRFFVGQIATGGIGITLTASSYEYFYSNDWPAENRIQAEDRIHRIGQKDGAHYTDVILEGSYLDRRVYRTVKAGKDYHAGTMEAMAERKKVC